MEVDSSLDTELAAVSKKYSSQKQLITQLQTENAQLRQQVDDLRDQLRQLRSQQPHSPAITSATSSSPSATAPLTDVTSTPQSSKSTAAAASPTASLDTQPLPSPPSTPPQLPPPPAASSPPPGPVIVVSSPLARVTRSQTRLSSGIAAAASPPPPPPPPVTPPVERQVSLPSSNDRLLDELLQADQPRLREDGKRKRKMSVADGVQAQQADKRTAREETKETSSPTAVDSVDAVAARAEAEYEKGKAVKDSDPSAGAAHFEKALQILSSLSGPPTSLPLSVRHLHATLYYGLAVLSSGAAKREESRGLILQALEWRADWHKAWRGLANVESNLRRYDKAIEAYERALQYATTEEERLTIERLRRISEQAMRASPQAFLNTPRSALPSQLSPSTSPIKPTRDTVQSGRSLASRLDQADFASRRVLGDLTNVQGEGGQVPGVGVRVGSEGQGGGGMGMSVRNRQALLRLPVVTKEGVRDLLGSERFALAGALHECKALLKWKVDGVTVEAQMRDTSKKAKGTKTFLEQAATFDGDRVVSYRCDCMKRGEGEVQEEFGHRKAQELVPVRDSTERCWRYGACEHIGALLLVVSELQKDTETYSSSSSSSTPPPARPLLIVHPVHRPSAAQVAVESAALERYERLTVDALRVHLKRNETRTTGVKVEVVMRCVEGEMWGVAERCQQCGLGYVYYSGGVWRCRGWFDKDRKRHIACDNVLTQPRLHPWRS